MASINGLLAGYTIASILGHRGSVCPSDPLVTKAIVKGLVVAVISDIVQEVILGYKIRTTTSTERLIELLPESLKQFNNAFYYNVLDGAYNITKFAMERVANYSAQAIKSIINYGLKNAPIIAEQAVQLFAENAKTLDVNIKQCAQSSLNYGNEKLHMMYEFVVSNLNHSENSTVPTQSNDWEYEFKLNLAPKYITETDSIVSHSSDLYSI